MKKQLSNYLFKKEAAKSLNQGQSINLDEAKSFIFLFEASTIEDIKAIKSIASQKEFKEKKVQCLSYINDKDLPEFKTEAHSFSFITNKDLNLASLPKKEKLNELQASAYDVLINFSTQPNNVISYLALKTKARFKVSSYNSNESFIYDLMIDCKKDTSIVNFTAQVLHYLSLIKK